MKLVSAHFECSLDEPYGAHILRNIELAGRTCYQSGDAEPAYPYKTQEFVRKIIKRGHESVLEHEKVTVRIVCDRGVSHELVRHRLASYSQESTRYCNYANAKFGDQISVIDITAHVVGTAPLQEWCEAMHDAERHYFKLLELGCKPEIARSVLPNSLKTEIVVTANIREWRHIFKLRTAKAAHPQMREIMVPLLAEFQRNIPVVFADIKPGE